MNTLQSGNEMKNENLKKYRTILSSEVLCEFHSAKFRAKRGLGLCWELVPHVS